MRSSTARLPGVSMPAANLKHNGIREEEVRYFGRILAGQCHELVNALNIAHELCGLHEDTLPLAREGHSGAVEKLGSLAQRIDAQIARSNAIIRDLGRFAHSVDEPVAPCDAREIVERAVFFAVRQARLRQTELRTVLPEGDAPLVYGNPFRLQRAIHAGIELLLEGIREGRRITVSLTLESAGVVARLESADPLPSNDAAAGQLTEVAALVHAAGGEMRETSGVPGRIVCFIPFGHRDATACDSDTPARALVEVADVD